MYCLLNIFKYQTQHARTDMPVSFACQGCQKPRRDQGASGRWTEPPSESVRKQMRKRR